MSSPPTRRKRLTGERQGQKYKKYVIGEINLGIFLKIHNYCKDNEMQNRRWEYFCERNLGLRGWWGCNEIRYLLADYKSLYSRLSDYKSERTCFFEKRIGNFYFIESSFRSAKCSRAIAMARCSFSASSFLSGSCV